jgi:hypothetical protein
VAVTEPVCCAAAAITAIAAPEREVRRALQLRLEIIFSSAKSGSEVVGDIEGDLTEKGQLLFGSGVIVIEGGQWPSGTDLGWFPLRLASFHLPADRATERPRHSTEPESH